MKCNYDFLSIWNGHFSHLPKLNYECKIKCLQYLNLGPELRYKDRKMLGTQSCLAHGPASTHVVRLQYLNKDYFF